MKRFLLNLSGTYLIIFSFLILGLSIISWFGLDPLLKHSSQNLSFNLNKITITSMIIFEMGSFIWCLLTGMGLLVKDEWARYSLFIMSGFAILLGSLFALVSLSNIKDFWIFGIIFLILLMLIPLFFILFFSNKKVAKIFSEQMYYESSKMPFGIRLLAILYLLGIANFLFAVNPLILKLPLFGITLSGMWIRIYFFIMGLINLSIGIGFFRRAKLAYYGFLLKNLLLFIGGFLNKTFITDEKLVQFVPQNKLLNTEAYIEIFKWAQNFVLFGIPVIILYIVAKRNYFFGKNRDSDHFS